MEFILGQFWHQWSSAYTVFSTMTSRTADLETTGKLAESIGSVADSIRKVAFTTGVVESIEKCRRKIQEFVKTRISLGGEARQSSKK